MSEMVSAPDAAIVLGVSHTTIHRLVSADQLRGWREGRRLWIDRDELDKFAETYRPRARREDRERERLERRARMRRGA